MLEQYVDIQDYEGLYQVSNLGNVRSLPKGNGNGYKERLLKSDKSKVNATGEHYHRVSLATKGVVTKFQVHRLVAQHFIPNPENKPFINHIDGNPSNNCVTNLEWCTGSENMTHAYQTGLSTHAAAIATAAAAAQNQANQIIKYTDILGDRFLGEEIRNKRRFITYQCLCGNVYTKRADSPPLLRGGVCSKFCQR